MITYVVRCVVTSGSVRDKMMLSLYTISCTNNGSPILPHILTHTCICIHVDIIPSQTIPFYTHFLLSLILSPFPFFFPHSLPSFLPPLPSSVPLSPYPSLLPLHTLPYTHTHTYTYLHAHSRTYVRTYTPLYSRCQVFASALNLFQELELWDEVVSCYQLLQVN